MQRRIYRVTVSTLAILGVVALAACAPTAEDTPAADESSGSSLD